MAKTFISVSAVCGLCAVRVCDLRRTASEFLACASHREKCQRHIYIALEVPQERDSIYVEGARERASNETNEQS